jgi:pimeloyl-ACP methyl ester carboxylesterase
MKSLGSAAFTFIILSLTLHITKAQQFDQFLAREAMVNGATIKYWEQGRGVPVVFVHGAISDHRYWDPQREAVARKYRFIALDRRYFGTAPWPDDGSRNSQANQVADLATFIKELKAGPVFLVGTSGGAVLSLLTALQHPQLVRGLFVNEPGLRTIVTDPAERKLVSEFDNDSRRAAAREAAKAGKFRDAARIFADFANGQPGTFDAAPSERQIMYVDNVRTLALGPSADLPITCEQLGRLRVPVTITVGQLTKSPSKLLAEVAQRCLPGSRLVTIPEARHGAPWQNPSAFNEALLSFLDASPALDGLQPDQPLANQAAINGTAIRYWEQGRGVPVVFVHGAISDHRYWENQREAIAKKHRLIAIDRRYFGTAPWPDDGAQFSQAAQVADLATFIRELKIGPVFLVGISGGAGLSLLTAVQYPGLVRGLFVHEPGLDSILTDPTEQKLVIESRANPQRFAARDAAKAGKMEEAARLFVDNVSGQPGRFDKLSPELKAMFIANARTLTLDARPPVPITCAQLGQIKVPVTITKGELTKPVSKILAEAAHRCIAGSQLITIPAAGHGAPSQNPSAFNEALLSFLSVSLSSKESDPSEEMQVKKLKVNDVELAYVEEGKGETVVFVHGGGVGDWRSWERLRPFISAKFHYVSLSRRYHYPNPWMDDGRKYTMEQHVEDVAAFIRALNVGKVHLVGNSYGGGIVARVALKYPELLRTVVFGEGLLAPVSAEGVAAGAAAQKGAEKLRRAFEAGELRQAAILQYDNAMGEPGAFEKLPLERQQQLIQDAKTLALEQQNAARGAPLTCELVASLSVPALLIRGEKTGPAQRYRYETTASCLPKSAKTAIIPGAPHSWHAINPADSAKAILNFLDEQIRKQ